MTADQFDSYNYGAAWWDLADRFGFSVALEQVAAAASARDLAALNAAISDTRRGTSSASYPPPGSDSTWSNFWDQIGTDPLGAPLEAADRQIARAVANVFKNPFVLIGVAALGFYLVGGFDWLKRKVATA